MSSVYAGTETYHGSIVIPSDGDPAVAESVNIALRDLMDNSIVFRTDFQHVAADDRGNTSTIAGDIIWNDGGGSFESNIPSEFNGGLEAFGQPLTIHSSSSLECNGPADFDGDVTVGSTGTDDLTVNSTSAFNAPVTFNSPVEISGDLDTFTTHGDVHHGGGEATFLVTTAIMQLGNSPTTQVLNVGVNANFDRRVNVGNGLNVDGSTVLGNDSGDTHSITGEVTCEDGLTVREDLTVEGDGSVEGNLTVEDDITCRNMTIQGDTIVGNNSASDTVTFNAPLTGGLTMGANGRVLPSTGSISASGTTTLTVASSRIISVLGGSSPILLAIDDTGMVGGDQFMILFSAGTSTLEVYIAGTAITETVSVNSVFLCTRFPGAAATNWSIVNWNRD